MTIKLYQSQAIKSCEEDVLTDKLMGAVSGLELPLCLRVRDRLLLVNILKNDVLLQQHIFTYIHIAQCLCEELDLAQTKTLKWTVHFISTLFLQKILII